jgi:23S rRNA (adenine2503-C2)-methyltransferase
VRPSLYGNNLERIETWLLKGGHSISCADTLFRYIYNGRDEKFLPQFSSHLLEQLDLEFSKELPLPTSVQKAKDGTIKFLLKLHDGEEVEAVLIPFNKRYTLCVSSQVGCAMNCDFCYTGTMGLKRNLAAGEIVAQYLFAYEFLQKEKGLNQIRPNIVLMGMGEPLHNFEEVKMALKIFTSEKGLALSPRQITLSTVGYLPGLKRWHEVPPVNLALSLHSPIKEVRNQLIPVNRGYPLPEVMEVLDKLPLHHRQVITYEYLLISGLTDRDSDAHELAKIIIGKKAMINLIPFNPYPGSDYKRPSTYIVERFKKILLSYSLKTMVRTTKGDEILAACGQLKAKQL